MRTLGFRWILTAPLAAYVGGALLVSAPSQACGTSNWTDVGYDRGEDPVAFAGVGYNQKKFESKNSMELVSFSWLDGSESQQVKDQIGPLFETCFRGLATHYPNDDTAIRALYAEFGPGMNCVSLCNVLVSALGATQNSVDGSSGAAPSAVTAGSATDGSVSATPSGGSGASAGAGPAASSGTGSDNSDYSYFSADNF